ncbi:MAG: AAA family ATPase [Flavobacteriales bacterium]|nr:AAA family ATPase [Flavobacteriales bacterium]
MSSNAQFNYITAGAETTADEVDLFLNHMLQQLSNDERVTPLCIWGTHGIGKTQMVEAFANKNNCKFSYIAPAQFEEMGDLIGLPTKKDEEYTAFLPPQWVPTEEGPGILLIDDVNRADDRILRGIMQLLQNHELVSWSLPKKWMMVLTANPDGGDYSVTPMDNAMLTRMSHVTFAFDVKVWSKWAENAGIDSRGISFVLTYPEIINNKRTTPRSLVQFFELIKNIKDLKKDAKLLKILAESNLDKESAVAFMNFVNLDMEQLISSDEILNAKDFKTVQKNLKELVDQTPPRLDILAVIIIRLTNFLLIQKDKLDKVQFENLKKFILLPFIPNDLRLSMAQDLVNSKRPDLMGLYAVPEIGKLILNKM